MWFYSLVFFFIIGVLSLGYFFRFQKISYLFCVFLLIVIAGLRPETSDQDHAVYIEYYKTINSIPYTFLEPTYFLITAISKLIFNSPLGIFIIYAILGVGLKGIALTRLTKYYSVSLILYFGSFFLLHEMTQIRVGVASAILLLSVPAIVEKKKWEFMLFFLAGMLFHYSFIVFGFLYFVDPKKLNRNIYLGMILFAICASAAGINLVSLLQFIRLGFVSDKINNYKVMLEEGLFGDIKLLNPLLFLRIITLSVLVLNWKFLQEKNRFAVVLIKIYAFSIFFFIAFSDLPVLAGRLSQLFGIVEIIVVPFVIYLITPKYYGVILSILFALLIFYKQLYYSDLVYDYFNLQNF